MEEGAFVHTVYVAHTHSSRAVLEAFGNAKTLRNNNSSRFGKWMEVNFGSSAKIVGCRIVNYLLEKSRVVQQTEMERNYHVFYMLLAGATPDQKKKLKLKSADDYAYLNKSGCTMVQEWDDVEEFKTMIDAFKTLEFQDVEIEGVQSVLATILHIGNITFDALGDDNCKVSQDKVAHLNTAAGVMQVGVDNLETALTSKLVMMGGARGSMVTVSLNQREATATRDALAKSLYGRMFDWLVLRVNDTLNKATNESANHVGVLDIFGFEVFKHNSFEQLCINYANEKLQYHFNDFIFNEELKMYKSEGVPYETMTFKDNQKCLDLIEGKPLGLIKLIDEECNLGKGSDSSFAGKLFNQFDAKGKAPNEYYSRARTNLDLFSISHFAGPVEYDSKGFLEKNKDTTSDTLLSMARTSSVKLIQTLYKREEAAPSGSPPKRGGGKKKLSTIGGQFSSQLDGLMVSLRKTMPHFIRCVKSNHDKVPHKFDGKLCLDQLKYAGLFEAIRIRKAGYSYRIPHETFARRYAIVGNNLLALFNTKKMSHLDVCKRALETATEAGYVRRENWEVGKTKVFLKEANDKQALEEFRQTKVQDIATLIQSVFRMFRIRKATFKDKYEAAQREAKIKAENAKNGNAACLLQTIVRGHFIRKRSKDLQLIVLLKVAMTKGDDAGIEDALAMFEGHRLSALADKVIYSAKAMLRQKREKAKVLQDVMFALDSDDVPAMIELVERADQLGLGDESLVLQAKDQVQRIRKKRVIHKKLLDFLDDDTKHSESILELLDEAKALGIDLSFRKKVEFVYKDVAPKLEIRNKLRRGVEFIDAKLIQEAVEEVGSMIEQMGRDYGGEQSQYNDFCFAEKAAGQKILKMIELEKALLSNGEDNEGEFEEGCRLTPSYLELCDSIATESSQRRKSTHKQQLLALAGGRKEYEKICRSYKWGRIYSSWKFHVPEVGEEVPEDDESFYGLHPQEAYQRSLFTTEEFFHRTPQEVGHHAEEKKDEYEDNIREVNSTLYSSPSPRKNKNRLGGLQASGRLSPFGEKLDSSPLGKSSGREFKLKGALDMGSGHHRLENSYSLRRNEHVGLSDLEKKMIASKKRVEDKKRGLQLTIEKLSLDSGKSKAWH